MIRDDTRQTIKFVVWTFVLVIAFYIASIFVFYRAGSQSRDNDKRVAQLASQKTPITNIQSYYHLDRGVSSYSIQGSSKKGQNYYFIYLPKTKKAYLLSAKKGVNENKIQSEFKRLHPEQNISEVNLGWYKGEAVWEVASQNKNKEYSYTLYEFKSGNEISEVANL
ncbi:hypothetical protein [Lactobacillus sp. LL6]|uniref:hypothetical protein n=1 Tax=Lactobacillus sp. LL6 TaxID=2596827 RepID=UPI001186CCE8|nr:hypothetical protein [Lactobacillus sp. LL6]TSO26341.1 hypothetical protein FOD82_04550 [Lactobacillus sp. LL6]